MSDINEYYFWRKLPQQLKLLAEWKVGGMHNCHHNSFSHLPLQTVPCIQSNGKWHEYYSFRDFMFHIQRTPMSTHNKMHSMQFHWIIMKWNLRHGNGKRDLINVLAKLNTLKLEKSRFYCVVKVHYAGDITKIANDDLRWIDIRENTFQTHQHNRTHTELFRMNFKWKIQFSNEQ